MAKCSATACALGLLLVAACPFAPEQAADTGGEGPTDDGDLPEQTELDAGAPEPESDAGTDAGDTKLPELECTDILCCEDRFAAFPAAIPVVGGSVNPEELQSFEWTLAGKPEGSAVTTAASNALSFSFQPDVPGVYTWCLSVEAQHGWGTGCCLYTALENELKHHLLNYDASTHSIEDVEFFGGTFVLVFEFNQPIEADLDTASVAFSNPDVHPATIIQGEANGLGVQGTLTRADGDAVVLARDLLQPGDSISLDLDVALPLTGGHETVRHTLELPAASEPDESATVITEAQLEAVSGDGGSFGTIRVRFDDEHPVGVVVALGGWDFAWPESSPVHDDGVAPDELAGDGWYSGELLLPANWIAVNGQLSATIPIKPGTYNVLLRGVSALSPYYGVPFRTTLQVDLFTIPDE